MSDVARGRLCLLLASNRLLLKSYLTRLILIYFDRALMGQRKVKLNRV